MALQRVLFLFVTSCILFLKCDEISNDDSSNKIVLAVLEHLNSKPNNVYGYKNGTITNAQQKADIIELTLEVDAKCTNNIPDVPCSERIFTCTGFVQKVEEKYTIPSDLVCKPVIPVSSENIETFTPNENLSEKVELSHEAVSSESGEKFVAIRNTTAPCLNCLITLNPNVEGVQNLLDTALRHVESERTQRFSIVRIINLQQQVTLGVNYYLLVEMASTLCKKDDDLSQPCSIDVTAPALYCNIQYLQKPWISPVKNIVQNNCTVSQEFAGVDKNDLNDIEQQIIKKPDVVRNEMEPSRLADLESQIIFDNVETVNQDQVAPISNAISQKNVPQIELLPAIVPIHEPLVVEELNPVIYQRRPNEGYFYDLFEAPVNQYEHIQPTNEYVEPVQQWPSQPNDFIEEPKQFLSPPPEEFPEPITIKNTSVPLNFNEFQSDEPVETTTTVEEETTILPSSEKPIKTITVSSESKESSESSEELVKNRVKRKDTNKQSSESEESTEKSNLMTKQSAESGPSSEEVGKNRIKRSDSSSSSSSSSSEEDDKTTKKEKATKIKAKDDNNDDNNNNDKDSDSSSSSSEDEENNEIRPKRSIGQLEKITQDEKPIVKDLADFAAASLDKIDDDKYKRVILQILGAKKLHLDGIYYSLILRLGISHCLEDAYITDECRNNLFTNLTKICKVQVHVEDDLSNPKVVKSQCQNIKKDEYDRNRTNYSRYKRFLIEHRRNKRQIPGGLKPIATNDETIVKFTQQTLPHLDSHFKSDKKHKVIEIISAQSQVVAGTKYIIDAKISLSDCSLNDGKTSDQCNILQDSSPKTCHIEVWDRPWLSITKYTVKCDNAVLKFEGNSRSKRQLLGGLNPIDVNDPRVLFFTKKTLPQLDNYFRSDNKHKIIEITSAQSQVVAGLKFLIDAKVSLSDCSLNDATNPDECNILQNSNPKLCSITVWDRPWLSNTQYTIKCDNNNIFKFEDNEQRPRFKRQIPGGFTPQDKNDPQILTFTKNSLPHLDNYFKSDNKHKIIEIISAKSQIVAGTKYVIDAKISLSDCSLNDANNPDNCNSLTGSHPKICQITVWDRPWLHSTQYTVKCDDNKILKFEDNEKRNKRNIDLPNDRSMVLTKQLLPHLDEYYKTNKKHKIIKILSAQNDLQDNSMKIIAEFALSDCSLNETKPTEECKTLLGTEKIQCYFDISCSHLCQFYTKYKVHCNKDNITFGHLKQDPSMFRYINTAIEYYNIFTKIDNKFIFKKLENAFFYKNSKSIWVLTYQMGLSDCNKVSQNQFCELLDKDNALTCRLTVNLQSNTSEFKCFDDPSMIYNVLPDIVNSPLNLNLLNDFKEFLTSYNKSYKTDIEFIYRMKIFHQNLKKIAVLNKFEQGTAVYGVTKYADMSAEEFSRSHGLRPDLRSSNELPFLQAEIPDIDLPTEFDWRSKGAVTEVKNQGLCGSCWAFSTTGNVEGQNFIQHGKLLEFSEQELVDCDSLDQGCEGGLMDNAYRSIEKIGGLETEQDYPYDGDDEKCHFNKTKVKVQLSGAVNISHDETEMAKWLTKNGPIAIAINANAMQFYFGGISHPYKFLCNPNSLDHGVLIVGYGVQKYPLFNKTLPFWIVKNSWSSYWGEQGYYRVYRGDGTCGLNQTPSSAIVQ